MRRLTGGGHNGLLSIRQPDSGRVAGLSRLRVAVSGGLPVTIQAWVLLGAFLLTLGILAWPLGLWLTTVMEGRLTFGSRIESPLYRLAGVKSEMQMSWLQYALALIVFNALGLLVVYALQRLQGVLPFNPQGMGAVSPDSSFDTALIRRFARQQRGQHRQCLDRSHAHYLVGAVTAVADFRVVLRQPRRNPES